MLLHMACNLLLYSSYGFEEQITIETFSPETLRLIMNLFICQQLATQGLKGISCSVSLWMKAIVKPTEVQCDKELA